jgi:hypothetical protein
MPYIDFGLTDTQYVPTADDGISAPIYVEFPLGGQIESTIYVGTNGYFTFDGYTGFSPFLFDANSGESLVAPFFTDINIASGIGQISYEVHNDSTSQSLLSSVDSVINNNIQTNFHGEWLLVAKWDNVPHISGGNNTNTFQGILVTDFSRSFAVFTYKCGDLTFSGGATIGFATEDGLFANHIATIRGSAQSIACLNMPSSPWVNVVYEISMTCEPLC